MHRKSRSRMPEDLRLSVRRPSFRLHRRFDDYLRAVFMVAEEMPVRPAAAPAMFASAR